MATNRTQRQRTIQRPTVPPALLYYFETGDGDQSGFDEVDRYNEFLPFPGGVGPSLSDYWNLCRDQVIAAWIRKAPCSRPWAFWALEAEGCGCAVFGGKVPSEIEQLAYLREHGLLTATEKRRSLDE